MSSTIKATRLGDLLRASKAEKGGEYTHTRIGDKEENIYAGTFNIPDDENIAFQKSYYQAVFAKREKEYLTEKQLIENGPIMIDLDLRYPTTIKEKQHTSEHVLDFVMLYLEKCRGIVDLNDDANIDVFIMEKKNVNCLPEKTKDGIHIIIGMSMHKAIQVIMRNKVLEELPDIWDDLPITNTWDEVFDEGVTKGHVNWQVYGSSKPKHGTYLIKKHYTICYDGSDWSPEENDIEQFNTEKMFPKLSARYTGYPNFPHSDDISKEFETACQMLGKKNAGKKKYRLTMKKLSGKIPLNAIKSEEVLDQLIDEMVDSISSTDYIIQETHEYAMTLPESYYGPGSYNKWIRVGWALSATSDKLFLTWLKFSCRDICRDTLKGSNGKFDWHNVAELYEIWCSFQGDDSRCDGLTHRSVMYWSKISAPENYKLVYEKTIDYFVNESVRTTTEFDLAQVLYQMYKDRFICVSIKHNCWYEYKNNRWREIDQGTSLRMLISTKMWRIYFNLTRREADKLDQQEDQDHTNNDQKRVHKYAEICEYLKKTIWKNNIMREARELFYDQNFIEKLDQNPYLLCFNNCVVDFETGEHRKGQPDDNISKCTNIDYVPIDRGIHGKTMDEVSEFISQLFPDEELRTYMWEHLASCLVGTNENQTFNIYTGSGRNGKSKLVELMGKCMGEYQGTVPITLITQKRNNIGSTSSEVVQLMGTRYAVMQEPSKGDRINEGIMKEITGGDPIQGRALFKDTVTFIPQFKLAVCTNTLFDITSNDDGTWRRIRKVDYKSVFIERPYEDEERYPRDLYPYQFPVDKNIIKKFDAWAPVFMSMLVELAKKTRGNVEDCRMVMAASDQYREGQDYLAEFSRDKIQRTKGKRIRKTELREHFREWYVANYGRNVPKQRELDDYMCKLFGPCRTGQGKNNGWQNVSIIDDNAESDDDEMVDDM